MNKDYLCHKKAVYYILENNNKFSNKTFSNDYINKIYTNLVCETKKLYDLIKLNESIEKINLSLDEKRRLSKEFKSLTNITWML